MTTIQITVDGAKATATVTGPITTGAVGIPVTFCFDDSWKDLTKIAVFKAGDLTLDRVGIDNKTTLPAHIALKTGCAVYIGVYGASEDGCLVNPTVWAHVGTVEEGAAPNGDESTDPALPVWQQLLTRMEALEKKACPVVITHLTYADETCPDCGQDVIGYRADMTLEQIKAAVSAGKLVFGLMASQPAQELGLGPEATQMLPYSYDGDHYFGSNNMLMLHSCQGLELWHKA